MTESISETERAAANYIEGNRAVSESINHPQHYGGDTTYEAIKVIEAWELDFNLGNAVKYISRAGRKPGVDPLEDLRKAAWYLDRRIAQMERATVDAGVVDAERA